MHLDSRDLRYFEVIAVLGHVRAAAGQLNLSQPAVSKCIARLEQNIGARLFEREGRGIRLTPVGEALLQQARRLNVINANALRDIQDFASGDAGTLRLGCGPVMSELFLPTVCALLTRHMPGVKVTILVGMNYTLREKLQQGDIDAILGLVTPDDALFTTYPLLEDTVVVAASSRHPLFKKPDVSPEDVAQAHWVLPVREVASRLWLDAQFRHHKLPPPQAQIEVNATPLLLPMIAHSDMLCFISRHMLARQVQEPQLKELPIAALTMPRALGLTVVKDWRTPTVQRFTDLLHSTRLDAPLVTV